MAYSNYGDYELDIFTCNRVVVGMPDLQRFTIFTTYSNSDDILMINVQIQNTIYSSCLALSLWSAAGLKAIAKRDFVGLATSASMNVWVILVM